MPFLLLGFLCFVVAWRFPCLVALWFLFARVKCASANEKMELQLCCYRTMHTNSNTAKNYYNCRYFQYTVCFSFSVLRLYRFISVIRRIRNLFKFHICVRCYCFFLCVMLFLHIKSHQHGICVAQNFVLSIYFIFSWDFFSTLFLLSFYLFHTLNVFLSLLSFFPPPLFPLSFFLSI